MSQEGGPWAHQHCPGCLQHLSAKEETVVAVLVLLHDNNEARNPRKETRNSEKQPKSSERQEEAYCQHRNMQGSGVTKSYINLLFCLCCPSPPPPPPPPTPPRTHSHRCGPLGCLSTARSDFDICWNAQWSVQAWKDIQSFDPTPPPFNQNLLGDIVIWDVLRSKPEYTYKRTLSLPMWPPTHATVQHTQYYRTETHSDWLHTKWHKGTQAALVWNHSWHWNSAVWKKHQYSMSKDKIAAGNPLAIKNRRQQGPSSPSWIVVNNHFLTRVTLL